MHYVLRFPFLCCDTVTGKDAHWALMHEEVNCDRKVFFCNSSQNATNARALGLSMLIIM